MIKLKQADYSKTFPEILTILYYFFGYLKSNFLF